MPNPIDAWKGEFGDAYHTRQTTTVKSRKEHLWQPLFSKWYLGSWQEKPWSILEVGAGAGDNLKAIQQAYKRLSKRTPPTLYGLEPNEDAYNPCSFPLIRGTAEAIEAADQSFDLVFTYGVLIHMKDPTPAMGEMYRVSRRYIMCAEYFSPKWEPIPYRDNVPLIKGDYGSIWMDAFDLKLLDYGFCWKRATGLDNITWWLFEKDGGS